MLRLYRKIQKIPRTVIPKEVFKTREDFEIMGVKLESKIRKLFSRSLAIREIDAGSSNAEEQELTALSNPFYDIERFGIHFVASPRHADMLFVTGPVARNMAEALRKTYEATPDPKIVVAVGDDAIDGGIFKGSYAVLDGVDKVIPVDFKIPGCPPSPSTILSALLFIFEDMDRKPDRLATLVLSPFGQHYPSESAGSYRALSLSQSSTLSEGHSAVGISSIEIPIR